VTQTARRLLRKLPRRVRAAASSLIYAAANQASNDRRIRHLEATVRSMQLTSGSHEIARERALALVNYLRSVAIESPLVRFGGDGDGGYLLSSDLGGLRQALSLGIADDVSADLALASRGLSVHCYDPSIDHLPSRSPALTFFKQGVSSKPDSKMVNLERAVDRFRNDDDLILLCDIESHEWGVFAEASNDLLGRFQQIAVEFHDLDMITDDEWWKTASRALANLQRTHYVIHVHASNYFPTVPRGGIEIPRILEATYLRRDLAPNALESEFALSAIDSPHDSGYPEVDLGRLWNSLIELAPSGAAKKTAGRTTARR
jgi:hypothetical protein